MNEDTTRDLNKASFEEQVLARLETIERRSEERFETLRTEILEVKVFINQLNSRLTTLEEKVDRRLQETRPIWENVLAEVKHINKKLDIFAADTYEMRTDFAMLDRRVTELERAPR